ncbi:hypothetical protein MNBD_GAMMA09-2392 [hydrothermal vent metagenome]|uniref:Uncharacterized protein n=1 Tax=hydrothermal vent metagenome TaxID=652676 RepID=A0A3B0XXT6_9ZZZZ
MLKIFTLDKILIFLLIALISSCSQENVKETSQNTETKQASTPHKSLTKAQRKIYRDGITALYNNDYPKAKKIFDEFIRNRPEMAGAYSNLALLHFKKNEYAESLKLVNKAIELNPEQAQAYNLRGQIYIINGNINKAKDDYLKAVKIKPAYKNAQYNLALLYDIYLQEIELAIKHYEIYMKLIKKPDDATKEWIQHLKGTLKNA